MPRARKTMTGQPAQAATPVAGQTYGMGVEQQRLQEAMPAPQAQSPAAVAPVTAAASPPSAPAGAAPAPDPMAAAASVRNVAGLLRSPTARPGEPVTHGLSRGLGAGPEVLGAVTRSPLGETMRTLSNVVGDPIWADLANRANL